MITKKDSIKPYTISEHPAFFEKWIDMDKE
jgi:hypothetical protein